jgi:hypothetical protein
MEFVYRKVTSSRPVYYSFFEHFLEATNWDVQLTQRIRVTIRTLEGLLYTIFDFFYVATK